VCVELVRDLCLNLPEPGGAPSEVVGTLASDDQRKATVSALRQREDVALKAGVDLLRSYPETLDELERLFERQWRPACRPFR
jgi:hypothetical protein